MFGAILLKLSPGNLPDDVTWGCPLQNSKFVYNLFSKTKFHLRELTALQTLGYVCLSPFGQLQYVI